MNTRNYNLDDLKSSQNIFFSLLTGRKIPPEYIKDFYIIKPNGYIEISEKQLDTLYGDTERDITINKESYKNSEEYKDSLKTIATIKENARKNALRSAETIAAIQNARSNAETIAIEENAINNALSSAETYEQIKFAGQTALKNFVLRIWKTKNPNISEEDANFFYEKLISHYSQQLFSIGPASINNSLIRRSYDFLARGEAQSSLTFSRGRVSADAVFNSIGIYNMKTQENIFPISSTVTTHAVLDINKKNLDGFQLKNITVEGENPDHQQLLYDCIMKEEIDFAEKLKKIEEREREREKEREKERIKQLEKYAAYVSKFENNLYKNDIQNILSPENQKDKATYKILAEVENREAKERLRLLNVTCDEIKTGLIDSLKEEVPSEDISDIEEIVKDDFNTSNFSTRAKHIRQQLIAVHEFQETLRLSNDPNVTHREIYEKAKVKFNTKIRKKLQETDEVVMSKVQTVVTIFTLGFAYPIFYALDKQKGKTLLNAQHYKAPTENKPVAEPPTLKFNIDPTSNEKAFDPNKGAYYLKPAQANSTALHEDAERQLVINGENYTDSQEYKDAEDEIKKIQRDKKKVKDLEMDAIKNFVIRKWREVNPDTEAEKFYSTFFKHYNQTLFGVSQGAINSGILPDFQTLGEQNDSLLFMPNKVIAITEHSPVLLDLTKFNKITLGDSKITIQAELDLTKKEDLKNGFLLTSVTVEGENLDYVQLLKDILTKGKKVNVAAELKKIKERETITSEDILNNKEKENEVKNEKGTIEQQNNQEELNKTENAEKQLAELKILYSGHLDARVEKNSQELFNKDEKEKYRIEYLIDIERILNRQNKSAADILAEVENREAQERLSLLNVTCDEIKTGLINSLKKEVPTESVPKITTKKIAAIVKDDFNTSNFSTRAKHIRQQLIAVHEFQETLRLSNNPNVKHSETYEEAKKTFNEKILPKLQDTDEFVMSKVQTVVTIFTLGLAYPVFYALDKQKGKEITKTLSNASHSCLTLFTDMKKEQKQAESQQHQATSGKKPSSKPSQPAR